MGWGSADEIFNAVARPLIRLGLPAAAKHEILTELIGELTDWDTKDASVQEFRHDPATVAVLYEAIDAEYGLTFGRYNLGWITWCDGAWRIGCHTCLDGQLGQAPADLDDPAAAAVAHNYLLETVWPAHDRAEHGGANPAAKWWLLRTDGKANDNDDNQ